MKKLLQDNNILFNLVESVNLFSHFRNGTIMFLPQHCQSGLMGDVAPAQRITKKYSLRKVGKFNLLVKLHFQLCKFFLTPGVQGNLGGSVAASLL